jgi:uncharacterized protein (TIRG00374 family)
MKRLGRQRSVVVLTILRAALAVGLVAWLVRSGAVDWALFGRLVETWALAAAALALLLTGAVLASQRVRVLLRPAGFELSLAASVRLTLIGTFFNVCLPGGASGDIVRIYYATGYFPGRASELTTIFLLDRAAGLAALVGWPIVAAPFFVPDIADQPLLVGLLVVAGVALIAMASLFGVAAIEGAPERVVSALALVRFPLAATVGRMIGTVAQYRRRRGALLRAFALALLVHTLTIGSALLLGVALNPEGFAWIMGLLLPLAFVANAVPLTPGGLGVGEAAVEQLFRIVGLGGGAEIFLGWRSLMLLVALAGLLCYLRERRDVVREGPPPSDSGARGWYHSDTVRDVR